MLRTVTSKKQQAVNEESFESAAGAPWECAEKTERSFRGVGTHGAAVAGEDDDASLDMCW
jgi:hypothetical protein